MNTRKIAKALKSLSGKVSEIGNLHPKLISIGGAGAARAEKQIPWICQTLDQAAAALESKRDPFGNPITPSQVVGGLKQLTVYVREPSYGTLMEMTYPGIDKPLQSCMKKLDKIIKMFD